MAQSKGGLGRGLSALIPGVTTKTGEEVFENNILEIPVVKIVPNKNQPRHMFQEESLNELAESIKEFGIIQPIIVRNLDRGGMYEIISGERRFKAAKILGLSTVPCIINHNIDDLSSLEMALIENIQRADLTPIELSLTYKQLIDEFKLTHEEMSKKIGKSRVSITNSLRLLMLPVEVQKMVDEEKLSAGHARALLGLDNKDDQIELAKKIIDEDINVRTIEKMVSRLQEKPAAKKQEQAKKLLQFDKLPEIEKTVSDYLEAPVNIKISRNKGKIEVLFGSIGDFERIVRKIIGDK
jgi:ParB family chromosome partitioning protein